MRISDSGKGFDLGKLSVGLGLESMRERMRLINGVFLVSSKPGCGTELIAQVILGK
jgi:signal transduction histidine kinase